MSEEIKVGDWVQVSDCSKEDAQRMPSFLYQVTGFANDGRIMTGGCSWGYAVHPNEVKVLPLREYESLLSNQIPNIENLEAGQELSLFQIAQWIEKYGDTTSLEHLTSDEWVKSYGAQNPPIKSRYRVAPKKVNTPDDPTTWEKGVAIFRRDAEDATWILDVFGGYSLGSTYPYLSLSHGAYKYAKLATPEQIEEWSLINEDL